MRTTASSLLYRSCRRQGYRYIAQINNHLNLRSIVIINITTTKLSTSTNYLLKNDFSWQPSYKQSLHSKFQCVCDREVPQRHPLSSLPSPVSFVSPGLCCKNVDQDNGDDGDACQVKKCDDTACAQHLTVRILKQKKRKTKTPAREPARAQGLFTDAFLWLLYAPRSLCEAVPDVCMARALPNLQVLPSPCKHVYDCLCQALLYHLLL